MTTLAVVVAVRPAYIPPPRGGGGPFDLTSALVLIGAVVALGMCLLLSRSKKKRGRKRRSKP